MNKRITLFILGLSIALLGGCGGKDVEHDAATNVSQASEVEKENTQDISDDLEKKDTTLSGYLSTEKTIAYEVSKMDKEKKPRTIYFFENGTVTMIPGSEFGLTMGDLAQMTDDEIWKAYETVRKTYKENYKTDKNSQDILDSFVLEEFYKTCPGYGTFSASFYYDDFISAEIILNAAKGKTYNEALALDVKNYVANNSATSLANAVANCLFIYKGATGITSDNYSKEDYAIFNYFGNGDRYGEAVYAGEAYEDAIEFFVSGSEQLAQIRSGISYKGPFYDSPFAFVIKTDASGNQVEKEYLVYPTRKDEIGKIPTTYYDSITFANVEGGEKQIYDSTYLCFGLGKGESIFCTRDYMTLDTLDSKNVSIDLSKDEMNELFKDEVMGRYE